MGKRAKDSKNKNMIIIVSVIAGVIVIALLIAFLAPKTGNNDNAKYAEQQSDKNDPLAKIQSKIDAQEKVINAYNIRLRPLVEERTKLEKELMTLALEYTDEVTPTEPVEPTESAESTVDESDNTVEPTEPTVDESDNLVEPTEETEEAEPTE